MFEGFDGKMLILLLIFMGWLRALILACMFSEDLKTISVGFISAFSIIVILTIIDHVLSKRKHPILDEMKKSDSINKPYTSHLPKKRDEQSENLLKFAQNKEDEIESLSLMVIKEKNTIPNYHFDISTHSSKFEMEVSQTLEIIFNSEENYYKHRILKIPVSKLDDSDKNSSTPYYKFPSSGYIKDLLSIDGNPLTIDCYNKKLQCHFEVQGVQHYFIVPFGIKNISNKEKLKTYAEERSNYFFKYVKNDKLKLIQTLERGELLIHISPFIKKSEIFKYIFHGLNEEKIIETRKPFSRTIKISPCYLKLSDSDLIEIHAHDYNNLSEINQENILNGIKTEILESDIEKEILPPIYGLAGIIPNAKNEIFKGTKIAQLVNNDKLQINSPSKEIIGEINSLVRNLINKKQVRFQEAMNYILKKGFTSSKDNNLLNIFDVKTEKGINDNLRHLYNAGELRRARTEFQSYLYFLIDTENLKYKNYKVEIKDLVINGEIMPEYRNVDSFNKIRSEKLSNYLKNYLFVTATDKIVPEFTHIHHIDRINEYFYMLHQNDDRFLSKYINVVDAEGKRQLRPVLYLKENEKKFNHMYGNKSLIFWEESPLKNKYKNTEDYCRTEFVKLRTKNLKKLLEKQGYTYSTDPKIDEYIELRKPGNVIDFFDKITDNRNKTIYDKDLKIKFTYMGGKINKLSRIIYISEERIAKIFGNALFNGENEFKEWKNEKICNHVDSMKYFIPKDENFQNTLYYKDRDTFKDYLVKFATKDKRLNYGFAPVDTGNGNSKLQILFYTEKNKKTVEEKFGDKLFNCTNHKAAKKLYEEWRIDRLKEIINVDKSINPSDIDLQREFGYSNRKTFMKFIKKAELKIQMSFSIK